jgi:hypothetical protein
LKFNNDVPAQTLSYIGYPPISDQRSRFREIFCMLVNESSEAHERQIRCEDYLWRLMYEKQGTQSSRPLPIHDTKLNFIFVTSAFGECFPEKASPYADPVDRLKKSGYRIDTLFVGGRSSSSFNAGMIADAVKKYELQINERLVLIGYSKGATDILHFLVDYPALARKVTAVLSIAGAINGSPIADRFAKTYARFLKKIPMKHCPPGDGGVLESLQRSVQFNWLAANPLPLDVQYYSIAAFTKRENVQPGLLSTYDLLRTIDPRNDGQLIFYDQIIPGSSLLGYVNMDHWDIAVPIRESMVSSNWAATYPYAHVRDLLFEAMILYIVENLSLY